MLIKEKNIDHILDFIYKEGKGLYSTLVKDRLEEAIKGHLKYGTCILIKEDKEIIAFVRWNWIGNQTAEIIDVIIKKEYRKDNILKKILIYGVGKNPNCHYIQFGRKKYPGRKPKLYRVYDLLKRRKT